jgi:hypothetical protein
MTGRVGSADAQISRRVGNFNAADQILDFGLGPVGNGEMSDTRID